MSARFYLHTMKMIYFLQEVEKRSDGGGCGGGGEGGGRKKRREMVCQAVEKRSLKCLELFTAEMANQY